MSGFFNAIFGPSTAPNMVVALPNMSDTTELDNLSTKVEETIHNSGLKGSNSVTLSGAVFTQSSKNGGTHSCARIDVLSHDLDSSAGDQVKALTEKAIKDAKIPGAKGGYVYTIDPPEPSRW